MTPTQLDVVIAIAVLAVVVAAIAAIASSVMKRENNYYYNDYDLYTDYDEEDLLTPEEWAALDAELEEASKKPESTE